MTANAIFFNAAIEGYIAGSIKGRALTETNPNGTPPAIGVPPNASYAALAAQAILWAEALDNYIPTDDVAAPQPAGTIATGVVSTGVAIIPTTGTIQFGQLAKSRLVAALTYGAFSGRYDAEPTVDEPTEGQYVTTAAAVAALYQGLALPVISGATGHNLVLEYGTAWGAMAGIITDTQPLVLNVDTYAFAGALALAVDTAIANDGTISQGSGMPLTPAVSPSGPQQFQLAKMRLIESIALAFLQGRSTTSLVAQNPGSELGPFITAWTAANAPVIVAAYTGLVTGLDLTTTSAHKNPTLYNEAYCGFVAAALGARPFGFAFTESGSTVLPSSDPSYVAIAAAAAAFAFEVDTTVGGIDSVAAGTIPTGAGTPAITLTTAGTQGAVEPTTGTLQEGQLGKTGLMWALCSGAQYGRPLLGDVEDTNSATYTASAQAIVSAYLELCTALNTP
jgi:hypothetical protein